MSDESRCVAAFDFDGTLSRRDTLVPFLAKVAGRRRFAGECARLGLIGARDPIALRDRDATKERLLRALFTGRDAEELRQMGARYARDLLSDQLRPAVLERLQDHRRTGHDVVFVSASLVYYLEPLAEMLGVRAVLAVEPAESGGRLTGDLARPNVRAEQKAVRLREWLGAPPSGPVSGVRLWGYGNSSGDHALLDMSDHAFWLGRPAKLPVGSAMFEPGPI
ncbi:MAG: HAD-IB family hydrolase [Microthrixaceae bacterium]